MPTVIRKIFTDETEEELAQMSRDEVTLPLNDKMRRFCEHYVKNFNIRMAAIKAGYSATSAHITGWKLRQKPEVNRYIAWLKLRVGRECHVTAMDIIDQYTRIAFADVTDFITFKGNEVKLTNSDKIDGQLVTKVKQGRDGITIELADKLSALDKLERYFDVMPKDWREKIEERKLELIKERIDFEKAKAGLEDVEDSDDGLLQALKESAEEVWEDE